MSFDAKRLYELLPAVYRIRDEEKGAKCKESTFENLTEEDRLSLKEKAAGPLKALLHVIADQVAVIEEDLAQLYDDQFIETCAPWVIPYLADLIGHPIRHDKAPACI